MALPFSLIMTSSESQWWIGIVAPTIASWIPHATTVKDIAILFSSWFENVTWPNGWEAIPSWTFLAETWIWPEQYWAMKRIDDIVDYVDGLDESLQEEILDWYKNFLTHKDLADMYLSELYNQYPDIAEKAIGKWLRKVMGDETARELATEHRVENWKRNAKDRDMSAIAAKWAAAIAKIYWWSDYFSENAQKWVKARWLVPRSKEEIVLVDQIIKNQTKRDRMIIANKLNQEYHWWRDIRTNKSVMNMVDKTKRRTKTQ